MPAEQDFSQQIKDLISDLEFSDENVAERAGELLREGAEIVVAEQQRLISVRSKKLPALIKSGKIKKTKKGTYTIACGYDTEAIKVAFKALIMEHGRPGKRSGGKDKNGKPIGRVEPTPHIFRGLENKSDEASQHVVDGLLEAIKW